MKQQSCSLFLTCLCALATVQSHSQAPGYNYVKEIVIQETRIPDGPNLSNFPFLFQVTDPDLRLAAHGGHVENSNGYDIQFYLNPCDTKLDHQLEYYDPFTGQVSAWVRIPLLPTSVDLSIYLYYGNDTVSVSGSVSSVWDADYSGVWHFSDDPSGSAPQILDGTAGSHHGTANGGMNGASLVNGIAGRALQFDEINDYIRVPDFLYGQELTVSFWFNVSEVNGNAYQYLFSHGTWATQNSLNVYIGENAITTPGETHNHGMLKTVFRDSNDANNFDTLNAGNTYVDGNWHYYTIRIQDFGGASVYVDGNLIVQYVVWGANTFNPATDLFFGGREDLHNGRFYGGRLDEIRVSTAWRTSNWIRTEYNNQSDPATFFFLGPEGPSAGFCYPLPLRITGFSANRNGTAVLLNWFTDSAPDTTTFYIERRTGPDGPWHEIGHISGKHQFKDPSPGHTDLFYRIRYWQGVVSYISETRKVNNIKSKSVIRIYPTALRQGECYAEFPGEEIPLRASLLDASGKLIGPLGMQPAGGKMLIRFPVSPQVTGLYFIRFDFEKYSKTEKILIQ